MNSDTDITLSFEQILSATGRSREWLLELVEEEIVSVGGAPEEARYSGYQFARIRRDVDAGMPALALIMRLLDEVEELRKSSPVLSLIGEE